MMQLLLVAAGGAVGAVLRFSLGSAVQNWSARGFPYGTLTVNVLGSLLIGVFYVWLIERAALADEWRLALIVGLLGSFTTFSSFSLETLQLIEKGATGPALMNVLFSVCLCLGACWVGLLLARQV